MLQSHSDFIDIQSRPGYYFLNQELLHRALRIKNASEDRNKDFDVIEKAGDAVLKLATVSLLMHKYPSAGAGELSRMESLTTCNDNLAHLSTRPGLHEVIWKVLNGGILTRKILADTVEALLGAIALDAGCSDISPGLFLLHLERERIPNSIPPLKHFSWKIKPEKT